MSTETKVAHTPGPWSYRPNGRGWTNLCGADGRSIWTGRPDEDAANRALIAAAPDLLVALKEARKFIDDCCPAHGEYVLPILETAIAKAEGREP